MPPRDFTLYVDESIYSKKLVEELVKTGQNVRRVGVDIPFGARDHEWLERAGKDGWTALTRDQRIRYRRLEKETLKQFGVGAFTFTGGQATAAETAAAVLAHLERMRAIATSETRPFLYTFGKVGPLSRVRL